MSEKDNFDKNNFDKYNTKFDYKYPTSSKTSPNKKARDYEGVEYIPSGKSPGQYPQQGQRPVRPPSERYRQSSGARQGSRSGGGSSGKRKMKSQSQSAMFMAIIVGIGVVICLGAFFLMFNLTKPKTVQGPELDKGSASESAENGNQDFEAPETVVADAAITGAVKTISNGTVTIINADDDTSADIFVNADTSYRNKYGQAMTLGQFSEGDIVIAEYDSINKKALVLRLDPEAWLKASIRNVEINPATTSVNISNETFSLSKNAVFLPAGTDISVKSSDVVTLKGRKTKIMTVSVEKRSGTLEFINKDKITDGTVEVDADIYKALEETGSLKVSTGTHTVVVKGANIDVFIKEVTMNEGETVVVDLAEAQFKEGVINLTVNEPDYSLSVNDEPVARTSEPLKLPFGSYKLKVSKDGFTSWEGTVSVNMPEVAVTANLTRELKMGRITVNITDPPGLPGSVYIDNALIGTAPVYGASVTYGTHQLTIKSPGYMDTSTPIIVEGDSTYNVTMQPLANTGNTGNTGSTGNIGSPDVNNLDYTGTDNLVDPLIQ